MPTSCDHFFGSFLIRCENEMEDWSLSQWGFDCLVGSNFKGFEPFDIF